MEKAEKSIKRWLKKKVKLTLATVVMFLITGTISYSLEIKPTNNIWENNNEIKEQVAITNIGKNQNQVIVSGVTINNNGNIEINITENLESSEEHTNLGNGIGIFSHYKSTYFPEIDIKIDSINNNKKISTNIISADLGSSVGNGIGVYLNHGKGKIAIEKIDNKGEILSNIGTVNYKDLNYQVAMMGNGIGVYCDGYDWGNVTINSINNGNLISGKVGNVDFDKFSSTKLGNGIIILGTSDKITIPEIINNSGTISGTIENSVKNLGASGNGIFVQARNINIANFSNTGNIIGKVNSSGDSPNRTTSVSLSSNGIALENGVSSSMAENNIIKNFYNSGIISGDIITDSSYRYTNVGNGIFLKNFRELSSIKNEGKIEGKVTANLKNNLYIYTSGNGIFTFNSPTYSDKEEYVASFDNNGIIQGKMEGNQKIEPMPPTQRNGNGVFMHLLISFTGGTANTIIPNFNNNGFIKGNIKNLLSPVTIETGNGILIESVSDKGLSIAVENFKNDGLILGEAMNLNLDSGLRYSGTGLTVFSQISPMKFGVFNNKGIISGKMENLITGKKGEYFVPSLETGIGTYFASENITIDKLSNDGVISGETKQLICESEKTFFAGAGNGIFIGNVSDNSDFKDKKEDRKLKIEELENKGIISGYFSGDKKEEKYNNGIGILITKYTGFYRDDYYNYYTKPYDYNVNIKNIGTVLGNKSGIEVYKTFDYDIFENKSGTLTEKNFIDNYNNYGLIIGEKPVRFIAHSEKGWDKYIKDFEVSKEYMADKGYAIRLNEDTTVKEVIGKAGNENKVSLDLFADGTTADYTILNTKISEDKKDAYQEFKDENLTNTIINGVGENSGVVTVKGSSSLKDGIINAYKTAVSIGDYSEFKGTNVIINGGGLRGSDTKTAIIKGTDKNNTLKLAGNVQLNGSIDLGGTNDQDLLSFGENKGVSTTVNIYDEISSAEEINVKDNTNMTLYETSKITGTNKFIINAGSQVTLRVNSLEKDANDGKYKNHALYNDSDKTLFISGDLRKLNDGTIIEEGKDKNKYGDVSILNIKTNGLGVNSTIALGNVKFNPKVKEDGQANKVDKPGYTQNDTTVWVKTNSILHGAKINETKLENGKYDTNIKIEAEKDLFSIANKVEVEPGKPLGPSTTIIPGMEIIKPGEPGGPTTIIPGLPLEPSKPINPEKPNTPSKHENLYIKLNEIYKGVHTSNDRNFNALNDIVTNYTFGDKDKGDYPVIGNEKMQMATLLGYLRSVYAETPYSFSNESTRKSMGLFHDTVRDNNFKAKKDEWLIYGGLVHQSGDQEQTYYGRNYHGFDTGTADTDAEIKLTGAYGQFEYGNTDTLSTGIMVGGTKSDVEVASSKLEGTGAYVGIYAKKDIKDLRLTAGAGYQYTEYDGTRRTINETYSEDYKDKAFNLYLDGKYSYDLGNNLYLVPKAGLSYTHIDQDGIKESNDKTLALNIDSKEFDVLEGTVGVDIKKVIPTEKGKHSVSAGISYRHILDGADADYLTADFGGNDFEILVPHKNKGQMSIGVRYEAELENGMFYDIKGNYFMNVDSKENTHKNADRGEWRVGVGIGYKFTTLKELALTSLFDFDKSEIRPEGKEMLKNIATKLNGRADGTLIIEGHTDSVGSEKYNQTLSEKRVNAVEKELKANVTNKKVDYSTKGYGETKPVADNNTEDGRAANRRVELKFNKR